MQNPTGGTLNKSQEPLSPTNQISPQRLSVSIRPGENIVTGPLSVKPARNYPLDIYLLMDLSYTMLSNLQNLKTLGTQIASKIVDVTTNYNLGFGSFIDKTLSPYISVLPGLLKDPCTPPYGVGGCVPSYSFKHAISLTSNNTEFNTRIQEQNISANVDPPEGGFDGILQAAVCQQLIKWRHPARHLLVFITDGPYHHAGDGKLGGVITPHPGTCLMDQTITDRAVEYEDAVKYDYPSLGQLREKLAQYDILPIFAVTSEVQQLYSDLASQLVDIGAQVATLARDSSNVVDLISNTYNKVAQQIQFQADLVPGVSITVVPRNCTNIQNGICSGVQIEQEVQFDVHVSLNGACTPELQSRPKEVNVRVLGFGSFTVVINAICRCPCEDNPVKNSQFCSSGNGTHVCGLCMCNTGRFGDKCQCDSKSATTTNSSTCELGFNNLPCSGNTRGNCVCGKCQCSELKDSRGNTGRYYGNKCECDDLSCETSSVNGALCGGVSQGTCQCGVCKCRPGYSGSACQCSDLFCINPLDPKSQICSGQGQCSCSICVNCKQPFTGRYCHSCMPKPGDALNQCANYYCGPNQQCAMCAVGVAKGPQCDNCTNYTSVENFDTYPIDSLANCQFTDNDCTYKFYVNSTLQVVVAKTPSCNTLPPWFLAAVIAGPLVGLAILGLIILAIVAIVMQILNAVELKHFEKELKNAKSTKNDNPLFIHANTEYVNPIYGK